MNLMPGKENKTSGDMLDTLVMVQFSFKIAAIFTLRNSYFRSGSYFVKKKTHDKPVSEDG